MPRYLEIADLDSDVYETSKSNGIYMSSDTWLDSPALNVEPYQVPGRNGAIISKPQGFENVIRKFDMYMQNYVDYELRLLKKRIYWKKGYMKLKSSYEDRYSVGYLAQDISVEPFDASGSASAKFSLYFSCKPQKYALASVDKTAGRVTGKRYPSGIPQGEDCQMFIYDRNSAFIQDLFAHLSASEIPDVEFFCALDMSTAQSRVSTNDSYGSKFTALVESEVPYPRTVKAFIASNPNALPETSASATSGGHLYLVVAMSHMALNVRVLHSGTFTADYKILLTSAYLEGYTGTDVEKIRMKFKYTNAYTAANMPSYLYSSTSRTVAGSSEQTFINEAFITLCRNGYPVDAYPEYLYTEDGETYFDIVLDIETQRAYLVKEGLNDVLVNDFIEIKGEIGGLGYRCRCIAMSNDSKYHLSNITVTMRGWDL